MVISSNVFLKGLSVHRLTDSELIVSHSAISIQDSFLREVLVKYFFQSFKDDERFCFGEENSLEQNAIFNSIVSIFENPESLHERSIDLAHNLFGASKNANIKTGDFFTAYFEDCVLDDEIVEVIGLFKAEKKDTFLKVFTQDNVFGVGSDEGININKLDKGTLIFNTEKENGYVVVTVDNTNKTNNAQYWRDDFLKLKPLKNEYYQTKQLVHLCQDFIGEAVSDQDKTGKIALFNSSMDYLKSNDTFSHEQYKEQVLQAPELIASYEVFREQQSETSDVLEKEEFEISKPALKQSKKFIRSVIKLDKNFHVYVHGNRENIQKGFDDNRQKNYYKLYFEEEA